MGMRVAEATGATRSGDCVQARAGPFGLCWDSTLETSRGSMLEMSHDHWKAIACCALVTLGAPSSCANAQVSGYEVVDLGTLSSSADPRSGAWAINDRHEVVGWAIDQRSREHGAVWLYCDNYGLSARQWHDLTALVGETEFGQAYDINMAGLVVGRQTVSASSGTPRAYLWDLATSPPRATELGTLAGGATTQGFAAAVNDAIPPMVVGLSQTAGYCGLFQRFEAFSYRYGDPPTTLLGLGTRPGDAFSMASGVNNAVPLRVSGRSTSEQCVLHACQSDHDAVEWELSASTTMTTLPDSGPAHGAQAWGINDAGDIVGLAHVGAMPCVIHATFWSPSGPSPIDLGSIGIGGSQRSRALRLNEEGSNGEVTVVGGDHSADRAYRWYRDSAGNWSGVDLNALISPMCGWTLLDAHDVSSDGWIVGDGWVTPAAGGAAEYHGFLLRPITCAGDLDGSCDVNGFDLGFILAAWTCSSPCAGCRADLNYDGSIDGLDLGVVLAAWGVTCDCWSCPSGSRDMEGHGSCPDAEPILLCALNLLGCDSVVHFNSLQATRTEEQRTQALQCLFMCLTSWN